MQAVNAIACVPQKVPGPAVEPRPWTHYLGRSDRAPSAGELPAPHPSEVWSADIGPATAGGIAVGDSVLAVQATNRMLSVLLRSTGQRVWRARLGAPTETGPLLTATRVFAATGGSRGRVYCYRLHDGRRVWSERVRQIQGALAYHEGRVFAATEPGLLVALDAESGKVAWRRQLPGAVRTGVTVAGERLVVATNDSLYLVDPATGRAAGAAKTGGAVFTPPAYAAGALLVTSPDGFIAAFDAVSLTVRWRVETGDPVFGSPAVARDTVFATTITGGLWRVPLMDPEGASHFSIGASVRASPAPVARGVLVGTVAGDVLWLDRDSRQPRWRLSLTGPIEEPPVLAGGDLVIADGRGRVQLWR